MNVKRMIQMFAVMLSVMVMGAVVQADIFAYWPLDEGEGDIFGDVSGNAYDGTVGGDNVEWTTSGYINNGLEFTFTTEAPYPEVEAQFGTGVLNIEELTCALWVKMSKPFRSWGPLFVLLGEGHDWDIEPDDDGILWIAAFDNPPEEVWWGGGETLDDNKWHHVALTCSNSQDIAVLYFDGVAVADTSESFGSGTGTGWPFSDEILAIRLGGPRDRNQWASYGGLLDEVVVYNESLDAAAINDLYLNGPRVHFKNRFPAYGAINIDTTVVLSWDAPDDYTPTGYDVYLGVEPNELVAEYSSLGQTEKTFDPEPDLAYETTYYWRLTVYEPNEGGTGGIPHVSGWWPFTTESLAPYITLQPLSQVVEAGETAVFTVAGGNTTNYTWKKVSDGSVVLSGEDATTLTIEDVELADEDFYYCELSNDEGIETSASAGLWLKRLISHWAFEDNLEDTESDKDGIVVGTDPNYAPGIDGQALELFSDARYVEIPDGPFYNFYPLGYTISFWVNCSDVDGAPTLSKVELDGSIGYSIYPDSGGVPAAYLEGAGNGRTVTGTIPVNDQQWHHLVFEYDVVQGRQLLYIDGVLDATSSLITNVIPATDEPIRIGVWGSLAEAPYEGLIDDLRIYSFPLGAYEVAHLYTDFETEEEICVENPEFDLSGPQEMPDCRVDIFDLAALAAGWLECNIVPTCK